MLYSGTDPESHITEYTLVYEDKDNPHTKWHLQDPNTPDHSGDYESFKLGGHSGETQILGKIWGKPSRNPKFCGVP